MMPISSISYEAFIRRVLLWYFNSKSYLVKQKTKMNLKYFFAAQIIIFAAAVFAAAVTCDNKGSFWNNTSNWRKRFFSSHSSFNSVLAMRFRSDCKYTKAALNLGSTHQLLASILALKNKEGSQVDALILWHITDWVKISYNLKPFLSQKTPWEKN